MTSSTSLELRRNDRRSRSAGECLGTVAALLGLTTLASAQLNPGDVVVIGVHGDGTSNAAVDGDAFSWVPLVDLPAGTVLYFSDVGYFSYKAANNGFGSDDGEEGLFRFTVPAGGIVAGTVQTVNPMNVTPAEYTLVSGNAYTPDLAQDWINLSDGGDQVVVFQDDDINDTLNFTAIFAVTISTTDWSSAIDADLIDPNNGGTGSESNLFPGLIDGQTAVAVGAGAGSLDEFDNSRYFGTTTGTRAAILAAVSDPANWEGTNASQSVSNGGPGSAIWTRNSVTQFMVSGPDFPEYCFGDGGTVFMGTPCTPCPCGNDSAPGTMAGCVNPDGRSADLNAMGVPDTAPGMDTLGFTMTGGSSSSFAVLTSGDAVAPANAGSPCFGSNGGIVSVVLDGLRCVVQNVQRHGSRSISALGEVGTGVGGPGSNGWGFPFPGPAGGLIASGAFVQGQTRYFQVIYRTDPLLGCTTGQNTTQAIEVLFQ